MVVSCTLERRRNLKSAAQTLHIEKQNENKKEMPECNVTKFLTQVKAVWTTQNEVSFGYVQWADS